MGKARAERFVQDWGRMLERQAQREQLRKAAQSLEPDADGRPCLQMFPVVDEIYFWAHQEEEHNMILELGFAAPKLKQTARDMRLRWARFNKALDARLLKAGFEHLEAVVFLSDAEKQALGDLEPALLEELERLIEDQEAMLKRVLDFEMEGTWSGLIQPSLVGHYRRETAYFHRKVSTQPLTMDEEIAFWNVTNAEHALTTSGLLDQAPRNFETIDALRASADQLLALLPQWMTEDETKTYVGLSLEKGDALDAAAAVEAIGTQHALSQELQEELATGREAGQTLVTSAIHPALIRHIIKEELRGLGTLALIDEYRRAAQEGEDESTDEEGEEDESSDEEDESSDEQDEEDEAL